VNIKALLALCVAILFPLAGYIIVKYYSDKNVVTPRRYYVDSVVTTMKDGKETTDTVWHRVANIELTNQLGDNVSLDSLKGKVLVADFFFTHCGSICPALTRNMKRLQDAIKLKDDRKGIDTTFIQFLSFTIDPERDSATVLKTYADRYGVNPDVWWMLTGPKQKIYDFAFEELKVDKYNNEPIDSAFVHTSRFTLLDKERVVRGYYNGLDTADMERLANDLVMLALEKDKKGKSALFAEIVNLWPIFIIVVIAVIIFMLLNRKPKF
jgi:protein SCO1